MGIETLLGHVTPEALEALPVTSKVRNSRKVEQHLNAFALHLRGVSVRGVMADLGLKNISSAEHSIKQGERLARELGLDTDRIRLKLAAWFEELAEMTMQQVRDQVLNGTAVTQVEANGSVSVRRTKHADPRMIGEAGRGLVRMAQFYGLMEANTSEGPQQTTFIQLAAPADGAAFSAMCSAAVPDATGPVVNAAAFNASEPGSALNGANGDAAFNGAPGDADPPAPPQVPVARG